MYPLTAPSSTVLRINRNFILPFIQLKPLVPLIHSFMQPPIEVLQTSHIKQYLPVFSRDIDASIPLKPVSSAHHRCMVPEDTLTESVVGNNDQFASVSRSVFHSTPLSSVTTSFVKPFSFASSMSLFICWRRTRRMWVHCKALWELEIHR